MPTGYTAKLAEGEQTFQEFALTCARAFGACIEMRDEPFDAPIPDSFEPSDYALKSLQEANTKLQRLYDMNPQERELYGAKKKAETLQDYQDSLTESQARDARYSAMQEQVNNWTPPTPEHENMKKFMLEQLETSKDDMEIYYTKAIALAESKAPMEFFDDAYASAMRSVKWRGEEVGKEEERARSRTEWVRALRKSLED